AQDAAKDVDEHGAYVLVAEQDAERVFYLLGVGAAAHVEEVGGASAGVLDDVHGGHRQAGAVYHAAHVAVELDVVQAVLGGLDLERVFLADVAQLAEVLMTIQGVVVEVDLGVEREQAPVPGGDERVDLEQRRVGLFESAVERAHEFDGERDLLALEPEAEREIARLEGLKAEPRLDGFLQDGVGIARGNFFDLHAARGRGHEHGTAGGAVHHDAQVKLPFDGQRFFDEQAANVFAFGAGLVRDQPHAEHLRRDGAGFLRGPGDLDAAALAASASVDLRLHHDAARAGTEQVLGGGLGFLAGGGHVATRHGDSVARQQVLGLVFVDFHALIAGCRLAVETNNSIGRDANAANQTSNREGCGENQTRSTQRTRTALEGLRPRSFRSPECSSCEGPGAPLLRGTD